MTKDDSTKHKDQPVVTTEKGLAEALSRLVGLAPTVASIIIAFTAFAYVVGWLHARAYYDAFGASWIVSELSTNSLLGFSWLPLAQLLFFIYLGITDLMESKTRYKGTYFVLRHGWWFVLVLLLMSFVLSHTKFKIVGEVVEVLLPLLFTLLAAAAIESILIRLQDKQFKWQLGNIYLIYAVVFFGFYLLPTQMGKVDAKHDRDPSRSGLPQVRLKGNQHEDMRLLASNGDRFYVATIDSTDSFPQILVVGFNDLEFVKKFENRK